jgi:hypothetical protein
MEKYFRCNIGVQGFSRRASPKLKTRCFKRNSFMEIYRDWELHVGACWGIDRDYLDLGLYSSGMFLKTRLHHYLYSFPAQDSNMYL